MLNYKILCSDISQKLLSLRLSKPLDLKYLIFSYSHHLRKKNDSTCNLDNHLISCSNNCNTSPTSSTSEPRGTMRPSCTTSLGYADLQLPLSLQSEAPLVALWPLTSLSTYFMFPTYAFYFVSITNFLMLHQFRNVSTMSPVIAVLQQGIEVEAITATEEGRAKGQGESSVRKGACCQP